MSSLPNGNLELDPGRDDNGSEGEGVGADGGDHDGRYGGVDHAGPGRHRVGRAPRRGGHNQPVTLERIKTCSIFGIVGAK